MKTRLCSFSFLLIPALLATGCSSPEFRRISASVLSQTGYVSETQAEGILTAGDKLSHSQEELTPEQEYYLGRAVSAQIVGKFTPVTKPDLTKYVNKVGLALSSVSDMPETFGGYHFVVVESEQINAMSAPSGYIFVSSTFVKALPDEDALAAVLAHEIAHVNLRHGVNAISNAELFSALSTATKEGISIAASNSGAPIDIAPLTEAFSESVTGIMDKLLTKGFDRKQEYEADLYAAALLQKAGYDSAALERVLVILEKNTSDDEGGWYATHPKPQDRIEELRENYKGTPASVSPVRTARFKGAVAGL